MIIEPFSFGVGDRFAHQTAAQLRAFQLLARQGVEVAPVWNKSHREHATIGSNPQSLRAAADVAVGQLNWDKPYYVDADHIRLQTVDEFIASSNFSRSTWPTSSAAKWTSQPSNIFSIVIPNSSAQSKLAASKHRFKPRAPR